MRMVIVAALVAALSPAAAFAQVAGCGFAPLPPLPPLGCQAMQPVCVCGADGQCVWQFVCVR